VILDQDTVVKAVGSLMPTVAASEETEETEIFGASVILVEIKAAVAQEDTEEYYYSIYLPHRTLLQAKSK
jgi:hypothetical protein